jgi:penicillin-binding protein 1A
VAGAGGRGLLAELLPGVAYAGVVVALGKGIVDVDVGPKTLRLADDAAARVLRWKGDKRQKVQIGDVIPVALTPDAGRLVLAQAPEVEAALVDLDPATGDVRSLVGGYDYARSMFDRAVQAHRQAGSSMKPFIYATALAQGFTPLSIVPDAPIAVRTATGVWAPSNYQAGKFLGPITLKTALAFSINTVSVRLTLAVGVDAVRKTMRALGITSPVPRHISIALGTPDVSLLEMTAAYAAFPAGGRRVVPRLVTKVTDDDGRTVYAAPSPPPAQAISPEIAYQIVDLMKGVVRRGTAKKAQELGRPTAGKTGTSTGFRDAWFIGYTPDAIAGVWVGRDNFKPIGYDTTGGTTALPIWLDYMKVAVAGTAARDFVPPPDVSFVRASETTGEPVGPGAPSAVWVPFARGTVPRAFTAAVSADEFSRSVGFP